MSFIIKNINRFFLNNSIIFYAKPDKYRLKNTLCHGLQIDLDESIDHVEPTNTINMKALLPGQLLT
jgi:hypothetical protein